MKEVPVWVSPHHPFQRLCELSPPLYAYLKANLKTFSVSPKDPQQCVTPSHEVNIDISSLSDKETRYGGEGMDHTTPTVGSKVQAGWLRGGGESKIGKFMKQKA